MVDEVKAQPLGISDNPNDWWREHAGNYPLLAKFWLAHSSFPATSASAERSFNMDGLVLTPAR